VPASNLATGKGRIVAGPGADWRHLADPGVRVGYFDADDRQDILLVDNGAPRDGSTLAPGEQLRTHAVLLRTTGAAGDQFVVQELTNVPIGAPVNEQGVNSWRWSQVGEFDGLPGTDLVQVRNNVLEFYANTSSPDLV
jgi:hypothetical protein